MADLGFTVDWMRTRLSRLLSPDTHWSRSGLIFVRRPVKVRRHAP
jgi:hypothetical protein